MQKTKIEYLTHTWNPIIMHCTPISEGCDNCWHLTMAKRLAKNPSIYRWQQKAYDGGPPILYQKELEAPLHLKKPSKIGVQFMGDLFHESLSEEMIRDILWNIQQCGWHTFFILTKRPERMKEFFKGAPALDNIWLGVSIENQQTADNRIPILLQISASHRWISIEPMLESVKLHNRWLTQFIDKKVTNDNLIDWIVLGGETGPKARPIHPDWPRSIRDQCQSAGVSFFFKSWGDGLILPKEKKRILDGREWNEVPKFSRAIGRQLQ